LFPCPPRAPTPSLFPYTTLFRSAGVSFGVHPHDFAFSFDSWAGRQIESELHRNPGLKETKRSNSHSSLAQIGSKCAVLHAIIEKDRKSTRLNSSHRTISYAVFCL